MSRRRPLAAVLLLASLSGCATTAAATRCATPRDVEDELVILAHRRLCVVRAPLDFGELAVDQSGEVHSLGAPSDPPPPWLHVLDESAFGDVEPHQVLPLPDGGWLTAHYERRAPLSRMIYREWDGSGRPHPRAFVLHGYSLGAVMNDDGSFVTDWGFGRDGVYWNADGRGTLGLFTRGSQGGWTRDYVGRLQEAVVSPSGRVVYSVVSDSHGWLTSIAPDGREQWRRDLGEVSGVSIVFARSERLVVGVATEDRAMARCGRRSARRREQEGEMLALSRTGRVLWRRRTSTGPQIYPGAPGRVWVVLQADDFLDRKWLALGGRPLARARWSVLRPALVFAELTDDGRALWQGAVADEFSPHADVERVRTGRDGTLVAVVEFSDSHPHESRFNEVGPFLVHIGGDRHAR